MPSGFASNARLWILAVIIIGAFGMVGYRLVELHVLEQETYLVHLQQSRQRGIVQEARRGQIMDNRGNLLAVSRRFFEVGWDPEMLREEDQPKWLRLATLLERPVEEIVTMARPGLTAQGRPLRWRALHPAVDERTHEEIRALNIRGLYANTHFLRTYPAGSLASHVIGFLNREGLPVTGLERHLDFYLRGQNGWLEKEIDGRRREMARFRGLQIRARDGDHIVTSLDIQVQHIVEEEVARLVNTFQPEGISIIVSDPRDGFILALANYPTFDPNQLRQVHPDMLRNRAVTDVFEPGSTFKIVAAGAALNEGLVRPEQVIPVGLARVSHNGRTYAMPSDIRPREAMTLAEVVARSSNRGAAQLGIWLGAQRMYRYSRDFGFGEFSGFPLGGEVAGILPPVSRWDGLTLTRLPIGHAVAATPLQVHMAMGAVANGGLLLQPGIVRRVVDDEGTTVVRFDPVIRRRVLQPEAARTLTSLLTLVVSSQGTAQGAAISGYTIAGKTGTTQKLVQGRYSSEHHVASFSGYLPANDPRVLITVIIDEPNLKGVGYGSVVAVPAFRNIAEKLIQVLGIPAEDNLQRLASEPFPRYAVSF